jgi:preprotein translocase subunit SecE
MNKLMDFFRASYDEITEHVTWTKFGELQNLTTLVLVASLIFAIVIFGADFALEKGLDAFYKSF